MLLAVRALVQTPEHLCAQGVLVHPQSVRALNSPPLCLSNHSTYKLCVLQSVRKATLWCETRGELKLSMKSIDKYGVYLQGQLNFLTLNQTVARCANARSRRACLRHDSIAPRKQQ